MVKGITKGHNRSRRRAADDNPDDHAPPLPIVAPRQQQAVQLSLTAGYTDPKLCLVGVRSRHGVCDAGHKNEYASAKAGAPSLWREDSCRRSVQSARRLEIGRSKTTRSLQTARWAEHGS
jgi:hypothetical protein